jgi:nucleotide-binding universal stress UspA family protein
MTTSKRHRVLIATDGSPPAQAAVATAVLFPWNADTALLDEAPIAAILDEARRFEATVIALGWRGHATFRSAPCW